MGVLRGAVVLLAAVHVHVVTARPQLQDPQGFVDNQIDLELPNLPVVDPDDPANQFVNGENPGEFAPDPDMQHEYIPVEGDPVGVDPIEDGAGDAFVDPAGVLPGHDIRYPDHGDHELANTCVLTPWTKQYCSCQKFLVRTRTVIDKDNSYGCPELVKKGRAKCKTKSKFCASRAYEVALDTLNSAESSSRDNWGDAARAYRLAGGLGVSATVVNTLSAAKDKFEGVIASLDGTRKGTRAQAISKAEALIRKLLPRANHEAVLTALMPYFDIIERRILPQSNDNQEEGIVRDMEYGEEPEVPPDGENFRHMVDINEDPDGGRSPESPESPKEDNGADSYGPGDPYGNGEYDQGPPRGYPHGALDDPNAKVDMDPYFQRRKEIHYPQEPAQYDGRNDQFRGRGYGEFELEDKDGQAFAIDPLQHPGDHFHQYEVSRHPKTSRGDMLFFVVAILMLIGIAASALTTACMNPMLVLLASAMDFWVMTAFYWIDVRLPYNIDHYEDAGLIYDAFAITCVLVLLFAAGRSAAAMNNLLARSRSSTWQKMELLTVFGLFAQLTVLVIHVVTTKHASRTVIAGFVGTILSAVVQTWHIVQMFMDDQDTRSASRRTFGSSHAPKTKKLFAYTRKAQAKQI